MWGRSETKGKGGVRYCRHKEGLASLKKKVYNRQRKSANSFVSIKIINRSISNFRPLLSCSEASEVLCTGRPIFGPIFAKYEQTTKPSKTFFNIFLLQTVTVISNGRIEQITRYNCVFTHILIIVFCAFSPGKKVHLCFFSTMYNFQKFLLLISMQ